MPLAGRLALVIQVASDRAVEVLMGAGNDDACYYDGSVRR